MFTRRVDLKENTLAFYIFEIVIIADQRCTWERFQLGFLHSPHRHRILLHAQPRPWRPQWVSQFAAFYQKKKAGLHLSNWLALVKSVRLSVSIL